MKFALAPIILCLFSLFSLQAFAHTATGEVTSITLDSDIPPGIVTIEIDDDSAVCSNFSFNYADMGIQHYHLLVTAYASNQVVTISSPTVNGVPQCTISTLSL